MTRFNKRVTPCFHKKTQQEWTPKCPVINIFTMEIKYIDIDELVDWRIYKVLSDLNC